MAIPPARGKRDGPGRRPEKLYADRAYDLDKYRLLVRAKGFRPRTRWEVRDDILEAFLSLACSLICWRRLKNLSLR